MSDTVAVAIIGSAGTVVAASVAAMATITTAKLRELGRRVGQPNGYGSLAGQLEDLSARIDELRRLVLDHIRADTAAFARIDRLLDEHVLPRETKELG
jgi:formiminotetrahydrofolate cyclodeaminase